MMMLSNGNKKYRYRKDLKVLTWGLPPIVTCPGAGECKKICYARAGRMLMSSATKAMARRFEQSKQSDFVPNMVDEIGRRKVNAIRIHDSGDFYNTVYLGKWINIAKQHPDITFFAYTKMVRMFKNLRFELPHNLKIIYSMGGKWDNEIDTVNDCHARVFETSGDMKKAGYRESPDNMPLCFHGKGKREGFKYHGVKKWRNCFATKGGK